MVQEYLSHYELFFKKHASLSLFVNFKTQINTLK